MEINDYQKESRKTAIYPKTSEITYPLLGLAGEVGEFCNKIKKVLRDYGAKEISIHTIPKSIFDALEDELGDICWYLANLSTDLKLDLDAVMRNNLTKLASRMERGKIKGSGDKR